MATMEKEAGSIRYSGPPVSAVLMRVCWLVLFAAFIFFLVSRHYVKAYSDPVSFLAMAESWGGGRAVMSRAPLYPMILYGLLKLMGSDWVFLSNIPFLVVLSVLLGLLALQVWRRGRNPGTAAIGSLAALVAVAVLFFVRKRLLLELVNPFREPLAFSLALGSVTLFLAGWGRWNRWWMFLLSGLLLGVATSTRETCLLIAGPVLLWAGIEMLRERRVRWKPATLFIAGLLIGIAPLLYRNYQHTGSAVVPSYAAEKIVDVVHVKWDIPIPGMSLGHFSGTGPQTLRKLKDAYTGAGLFLFAAGLIAAVFKRNRVVLFLLLPAVLIHLLFYSFYIYYKSRYLLIAELFALPIIAYGAAALAQGAIWLACKTGRAQTFRRIEFPAAALALAASIDLVAAGFDGQGRFKVWHINAFREQIEPHIERPACFFGNRHYAYMMSWLLREPFYEFAMNFREHFTRGEPFDRRLRTFSKRVFGMYTNGHYYVYDQRVPLCRNWMQFTPVYDFENLTVPLDHYGERLKGVLFEMTPWRSTNTALNLKAEPSGPALLTLDMRRPWDYPGRTFCKGIFPDAGNEVLLTNGVQFIPLAMPTNGDAVEFKIVSDAPVPAEPYHAVMPLNGEMDICFGMACDLWAYNLMSESVWADRFLRADSCQLYDEGTVLLPNFADTNHEVYAEFRMEFLQEHPLWENGGHRITASTKYHREAVLLPPRRRENTITAGLGPGRGGLRMVTVKLETTLPSLETQLSRAFRAEQDCRERGYVKIYDAHLYSVPRKRSYPLMVDVGAKRDGPYLEEGFYDREKSGSATARWTHGRAILQVRLPETDRDLRVRWRCLRARPEMEKLAPVFDVDGTVVPADRVERLRDGDAVVYSYCFSPGQLKDAEWNEFAVEVPTWNPERDLNLPDRRDLGLFIDNVVFDHPRN